LESSSEAVVGLPLLVAAVLLARVWSLTKEPHRLLVLPRDWVLVGIYVRGIPLFGARLANSAGWLLWRSSLVLVAVNFGGLDNPKC